jgi:hypothetical protein
MDTAQTRGCCEHVQQVVLTNRPFQAAELLWIPPMDEDTNTGRAYLLLNLTRPFAQHGH